MKGARPCHKSLLFLPHESVDPIHGLNGDLFDGVNFIVLENQETALNVLMELNI